MARKKSYQKGSVRLHNGEWTLRYREFNHISRKWTTKRVRLGNVKTKKTALRAAEPIMAEVNERNNNPHKIFSEITFREFIEGRWKAYTVSVKYQVSTQDQRASIIGNHLMPFFGDRELASFTPSDISSFLNSLTQSAHTKYHIYNLIRLMFDLAYQYDLIPQSPVRPKVHKPDYERTEKPTLTAAQIRAILAELEEQERLFALLIAVTGMRVGEAMALRWVDFNAEACELQINHTLYRLKLKAPKTEMSRRPIRLHPAVAALLSSHRAQSSFQSEEDFIFCRADGKPIHSRTTRKNLYCAMAKAGIERRKGQFGFHIFRHSAGSLLYAKTRDLKLVQGTLGHSTISTTSDIYVHLDDKVSREGTEVLTEEILTNCDLFVTKKSEMVS